MSAPVLPLGLTFDDVLLQPQLSDVHPAATDPGTQLAPGLTLPLPLLAAAMDTVTEGAMAAAMARCGGLGVIHKNLAVAAQAAEVRRAKGEMPAATGSACAADGRLCVGAAVGVGAECAARAAALVAAGADVLVVDTAHGHSTAVLRAVAALRAAHPDVVLMAGNVATAAGTRALVEAGAQVIKVGIGPGSICTTRVVAGVGVPQLSAVMACSAAAAAHGATVVADGGVRYSGDAVKALAAGAAAVMLGSLLAGTDAAPGETVVHEGVTYRAYRGMGSLAAMARGSAERYGQAAAAPRKLVPEGVEGLVPSRGSVEDVLHQLAGGLRAGMGYLGAATLEALRARAEFVRISPAGMRESHIHDIVLATAAPNYRP